MQKTTENLSEYYSRLSTEAALRFNETRTRKDGQLRQRPGPVPKQPEAAELLDFTNLG